MRLTLPSWSYGGNRKRPMVELDVADRLAAAARRRQPFSFTLKFELDPLAQQVGMRVRQRQRQRLQRRRQDQRRELVEADRDRRAGRRHLQVGDPGVGDEEGQARRRELAVGLRCRSSAGTAASRSARSRPDSSRYGGVGQRNASRLPFSLAGRRPPRFRARRHAAATGARACPTSRESTCRPSITFHAAAGASMADARQTSRVGR